MSTATKNMRIFIALVNLLSCVNAHATPKPYVRMKKLTGRLILDDSGNAASDTVIGLLICIVLGGIVLNALNISVAEWMTSVTARFTAILGGDFSGGGGGS